VAVVAFLLVCAARGATGENNSSSGETSLWTQIEAATGSMNLDGTLRLRFSLGTNATLKQLGLRLELEHQVETDATGRARSRWWLRGWQSSLAPEGRDRLRWQPLFGAPVRFERGKIARSLSNAGSQRWLIRESDPDSYDIRNLQGQAWHYEQGRLVGAEFAALGQWRFSTRGTWITRIARSDAAESPPLLQGSYDENGRLSSCQIEGDGVQRFTWNHDGQLVGWYRGDKGEVRLVYRDGLLSGLEEIGKPSRRFEWTKNPGAERGDARWAAPVHLVSDEANEYGYGLTSRVFVMRRKELTKGAVTTTTFNPRRRRVTQENGGFNFLVVFRSSGSVTALERIEVNGEVAERYVYDDRGQLTGLQRSGEPERRLSYDESGRVMALVEGNAP